MRFDPAVHERLLATYESLGLSRDSVGLWCLPLRDAEVLVEHLEPQRHRRILEVGTYVGVSTMLLALHAPQAMVHSVDPNLPLQIGTPGRGEDSPWANRQRTLAIAAEAARRLGLEHRVALYAGGFAVGGDFQSRDGSPPDAGVPAGLDAEGPSSTAPARPRRRLRVVGPAACRAGGPFDLVFIDGLHYHDAVQADLELAVEHLAPGGTIVLHDLIGLWGAHLRWATHRFLERHPEFVLRHEPYREIYQAIGCLVRREEVRSDFLAPHPARPPGQRLADEPRWRRHLLASAWRERPRGPVVELRVTGMPSAEADALAMGATSFTGLEVAAGALSDLLRRLARVPTSRSELVLGLGVLDELPDEEAVELLSVLGRRGGLLLLGLTPPGERGAAAVGSRTLPRNLGLLHAAGLRVANDLTLDVEPHLLPYWSGAARQSSHLLHLLTAMRRGRRAGPMDTGCCLVGPRGTDGAAAAIESRQLGILFRDLLMQHVLGKMPPPRPLPAAPAEETAKDARADGAGRRSAPARKGKKAKRKRRTARSR